MTTEGPGPRPRGPAGPLASSRRALRLGLSILSYLHGGRMVFKPKRPGLGELVSLQTDFYKSDVVFKIGRAGRNKYFVIGGKREVVKGFSHSSARRLSFLIRNAAADWTVFATLTYPEEFPTDGLKVKANLRAFLEFLRREEIRYVWVLEFQRRGAPHFHFVLSGEIDKDILAERWYAIVGSGDPRHLRAGTRIERIRDPRKAAGYMGNYAVKLESKWVPEGFSNVGRFWGGTRLQRMHPSVRFFGSYRDVAAYLRSARRWYKRRCAEWGFKWEWKGLGFCLRDGARLPREALTRQKLDEDV